MLLKDRVAVITGGAGPNGLGFATARMMAAQGATIVILDLEKADPAAAAARLGPQHMGLVADVTDKVSCDAAVAQVIATKGRIDVLVNNAGITQPRKTLDISPKDYDAVLDVSLRGTLVASQSVIPTMLAQKRAPSYVFRLCRLNAGVAFWVAPITRQPKLACWVWHAPWPVNTAAPVSG